MFIVIDVGKAFDKIHYPFMTKKLSTRWVQKEHIIIKVRYEKPTADKCNGEELKAFPLRSGIRRGYILSQLLFSVVLEVLAPAIRQEKEFGKEEARKEIGKEEVKFSLFADYMITTYRKALKTPPKHCQN